MKPYLDMLTFAALRQANLARLPLFKNAQGVVAHQRTDGSDWSIAEWTNAVAGEAGEACNIAKKIIRGDYRVTAEGLQALAYELADVVTYADITCFRAGKDLGATVREKFNTVSARVGCHVVLDADKPDERALVRTWSSDREYLRSRLGDVISDLEGGAPNFALHLLRLLYKDLS